MHFLNLLVNEEMSLRMAAVSGFEAFFGVYKKFDLLLVKRFINTKFLPGLTLGLKKTNKQEEY